MEDRRCSKPCIDRDSGIGGTCGRYADHAGNCVAGPLAPEQFGGSPTIVDVAVDHFLRDRFSESKETADNLRQPLVEMVLRVVGQVTVERAPARQPETVPVCHCTGVGRPHPHGKIVGCKYAYAPASEGELADARLLADAYRRDRDRYADELDRYADELDDLRTSFKIVQGERDTALAEAGKLEQQIEALQKRAMEMHCAGCGMALPDGGPCPICGSVPVTGSVPVAPADSYSGLRLGVAASSCGVPGCCVPGHDHDAHYDATGTRIRR